MKILSFTQLHVIPNLYDFLFYVEHIRRYKMSVFVHEISQWGHPVNSVFSRVIFIHCFNAILAYENNILVDKKPNIETFYIVAYFSRIIYILFKGLVSERF